MSDLWDSRYSDNTLCRSNGMPHNSDMSLLRQSRYSDNMSTCRNNGMSELRESRYSDNALCRSNGMPHKSDISLLRHSRYSDNLSTCRDNQFLIYMKWCFLLIELCTQQLFWECILFTPTAKKSRLLSSDNSACFHF